MSQVFNKMKIEVKREIVDIITAKQNDTNSRYLDVYLYDDGTPLDLTGQEVRIYMKKPDGKEIFNDGEITEPKMDGVNFIIYRSSENIWCFRSQEYHLGNNTK